MKWELDGKYAAKSGDYLLTKNWTEAGWIWLAFYQRQLIGRATTEERAKSGCRAHAKG